MLWLVVVQWAHVACGILWAGGAVALETVAGPVAAALPMQQRRVFGRHLGTRAGSFFAAVGSGTIVLGIVRGTILGPVRSLGALGTPYGLTWLVALALTAGLAVLGGAGIGRTAARVYDDDALWEPTSEGAAVPALAAALRHLELLGRLQLVGFALVLAAMVLLAVGL